MQQVLIAEHGGINEAYAETYALTGNPRWLEVAKRLRHRAVLDPLAEGRDQLAGLHANTQIPKVIGLARLHEVTGDAAEARTARFFYETVTRRHSYAIGGNSEGEHFRAPGEIAAHINETTCEACNTYNMLKLTRHLYGWEPHAALFDDYERAQLNHIMAHQRPDTGQFVYFMPMAAGARRSFSTPENSFWCCVGSGMESHAKHADSIYWRDGDALYVNLYIPSTLSLPDAGFALDLDTAYPMDGTITLTVTAAQPEIDHGVIAAGAEIIQLNGRSGRRLSDGGQVELRLARRATPMVLRLIYWGQDVGQRGAVILDGDLLGEVELKGERQAAFLPLDLPLPPAAADAVITLRATGGDLVIYEVLTLEAAP